jgi:peptidoglycan/xylan/chitin deacetylase (PgdA/CDA1 family)
VTIGRGVTAMRVGIFGVLATGLLPAQTASRTVAITIDDLPGMSAMAMSAGEITAMNRRLLTALVSGKVPAIGFVNEEKLYKTGEVDARIAVLSAWLDAGFDLGNHTFSHTSLNVAHLKEWEDDVVQGESVTRMLLAPHGKTLRYLRLPYLDAGPDLLTRRKAEAFLSGRGYRVAPVTIDGRDWYFADIYDDAHKRGDRATMERTAGAWLAYTGEVFARGEQRSRALVGYEPKQVVLLHDTWLEADHIGELLELLRKRGYRFITLDEAMTDPAYAQADEYVSDVGATSIEHWAATRGMPEPPDKRPAMPKWIEEKHKALDADESK